MHKLSFRWVGLRRIADTVSPLVYLFEHLDDLRRERVHSARLRKYAAPFDNTGVPQDVLYLAYRSNYTESWDGAEDGAVWLRLAWDGLPDERGWTWSRLRDVYADVLVMVTAYLQQAHQYNHPLVSQSTELLRISLNAPDK